MDLLTLGDLYISDFVNEDEDPRGGKYELKLTMTNSGAVKLSKSADPNLMYGKYWYQSGTNASMKNELLDIVNSVTSKYKLPLMKSSIWLDIACNDGTLLSMLDPQITRVGVDPVDDSFKAKSEKHADLIIQDFFSADKYLANMDRADVITAIAMFYDLEDPDGFLLDVAKSLKDDGVFVVQMSYTPLMIEQIAFDNICHEHLYYYTLQTINALFKKNGFKIIDCQLNETNGGSFRIFAMKDSANVSKFGSQPYRDVAKFRVESLLGYELRGKYNSPSIWSEFDRNIKELKTKTVDFIKQAKASGKTVWGYGASTKGNTLLQYFGLDNTLIDGIAERQTEKFGLKTVGTNIPIYSEEEMRAAKPDFLLVLPWHFINEFVEREYKYLEDGGYFIVPCPQFKIIGKEDIK